jgi:hypothetical protein
LVGWQKTDKEEVHDLIKVSNADLAERIKNCKTVVEQQVREGLDMGLTATAS